MLGIAQLGKRLPVTGGRVRVRTMSGKRIKVRGMLRTHRSGFFAIASNRLPRRFVVQISGGRVKTRAGGRRVATGRLQALVRRRSPATVTLAHVTFGTTVQARVKRRSGGSKSSARKRTLRAMRLPSYVSLGVDDRVNPRYVQKSVVRRLVRKYHGIPGLSKRVTKLALTGGSLRLSHLKQRPARVPVRAGRVRAQEVDESCLSVLGDFDPASLATCLGSSALAVAEAISGGNQQAQVIDALGSISADLQNVSTQVSDLQADLNDDFLEMMATQAQDQYDDAAAAANALVGEIAADFDQLTTIAAADPTNPNFNAFVYGRSIADPSPFSLSADAWFQPSPSTWGYSNWFGAGSGLIEFLGPGTGQIIPYPTAGSGQLMGPTGVWLNAPITGDDYGYTPPPSPTD
ncbi:MAG: hypothetical protein U0R64_09560 [Candidatus Nanopelagicales bacterium]